MKNRSAGSRWLPPCALALVLPLAGCVGGPIARQIVSSIATQAADNVVGQAVEQQEKAEAQQQTSGKTNQLLVNSNFGLDPDQEAFLRAQLYVPPQVTPTPDPPRKPDPGANAIPLVSRLATVEIWSMVIGPEKQAMLENMREIGMAAVPPEKEWQQWQLAEGGLPSENDHPLLILIPPQLGKMKSGDRAVIELGTNNGLYVARDRL